MESLKNLTKNFKNLIIFVANISHWFIFGQIDWTTVDCVMKFESLLLLTCIMLIFSDQTPCIIWKNSFIKISPQTSNVNHTTLDIIVKSRQFSGWYGVGFSKSKNSLEDSFFILNQFPNNLILLKNHTQIDVEKKILNFYSEQTLKNTIDGIFTFSFKMNSSLILEKRYVFFALSEESVPFFTNVSMIPRHSTFSSGRYFDLNQLDSDYPTCGDEINIAGRLLARNWYGFSIGTLICIVYCIAYVYFRNDQPLKSRFFAPFLLIVCMQVNLFSELLFGYFTFEESTGFFCQITGFITYSSIQLSLVLPMLMFVRYSILLQLHLHKREFTNNVKNLKRKTSSTALLSNSSSLSSMSASFRKFNDRLKETQKKPAVVILIQRIRQVLLILQSHWVFIGAPIIYFVIFMASQFLIFAISGFTCKSWTQPLMRVCHVLGLLVTAMILVSFYILDLILSVKNFVRCRWKRFFLEEDPFHYRIDMIMMIVFVPFLILWAFVPLPYLLSGIVVDVMMYLGILFGGGIALNITILKKIIFLIKTRNADNKRLRITMDIILSDEKLLEKYIEFSELEWSSENIYFKMDVIEYKKKNDLKGKRNIAHQLKENYLIPSVSPLEINVTAKVLNPTLKQMDDLDFSNDLFDKIEREVDVNLCDTLARFIVSSQYDQFLKENENVLSKLGL
jgi:hypothetical protein